MKRRHLVIAVAVPLIAWGAFETWEFLRFRKVAHDPEVCTPIWKRHLIVRGARRVSRTLGLTRRPRPAEAPRLTLSTLEVRELVGGLEAPTTLAVLSSAELLVLERHTGRVRHIKEGRIAGTALDLGVDSNGERGALGIVLHPRFQTNRYVYIYWTARLTRPDAVPGRDPTDAAEEVERLNRVDRFVWTGTELAFDRNILALPSHAVKTAAQGILTVHVGGVMTFGLDEELFVVIGDQVLRGQLQNVADGPSPTARNLTGVVLRLNDDGSSPSDNPFYEHGEKVGGDEGTSLMRMFAYGIRNSFGMDVDPVSGQLWITENGLNSFDEINRVPLGFNSGWLQIMGPGRCFQQYLALEKPLNPEVLGGHPDFRTDELASSAMEKWRQLVRLPNSTYLDPAFSWKFTVAPTALHFVRTDQVAGLERHQDVLVGDVLGRLYRFTLDDGRSRFRFSDPRLHDRVADNAADETSPETASVIIGTDFGTITDIKPAGDGSLYVVSHSRGTIYEIRSR